MNNSELASAIVHRLFDDMSEPNDKVQRIAFIGGKYPDKETDLGGMCQEPLTGYLGRVLNDLLPVPDQGKDDV